MMCRGLKRSRGREGGKEARKGKGGDTEMNHRLLEQ